MFTVPDSSDPPSTPNRHSHQSHPSTTPAGPPPSSRPFSFTPKGPPPSSVLGSSQFGTGAYKQGFSNRTTTGPFGKTRQLPSSPPQAAATEYDESDAEMDEEDAMEEDTVDDSMAQISPGFNPFNSAIGTNTYAPSRGNKAFGNSFKASSTNIRADDRLDIHGFAKGLAATGRNPVLDDPDGLIIETERIIEHFGTRKRSRADSTSAAEVASQFIELWNSYGSMSHESVESDVIGPAGDDENILVSKANFLSSLMLQLHCPPSVDGNEVPIPKVLLDWMDTYHTPSADIISSVLEYEDGYAESEAFWDALFMSLLRGRFDTVIHLLEGANFEAVGERERYSAQQLGNIEQAIHQAIELVKECPAVSLGDWNIAGPDWTIFRHRVQQTKEDLRDFAEGSSRKDIEQMQSSRFGRSSHNAAFSLSHSSMRAGSNIPWAIYEALQGVYGQLLGQPSDLLTSSFDWLEAVVAIACWWDGNEADIARGSRSLTVSRRSTARYQQSRQVDVTPALAYRQRLSSAFALAMEEEDLRTSFDSSDAIQVGLACIFEDDAEALVGLLQLWSIPIASAMAELASAGGWFSDSATARETVENFDPSDLMVLSYGQGAQKGNKKDDLLSQYADLLSRKQSIQVPQQNIDIEGWQLALRVLGRLDDAESANNKVSSLLEHLNFNSNDQVDHVLGLCNDLGFNHHAMSITEKYADSLSDSTHRYGDALLYYSRAHKFGKAKKVIDVLIASCLVQSMAYPPSTELDERMRAFISSPKQTFTSLASTDLEAAQHLSTWLSGYATLRKFYELRDEDANVKTGQKSAHRLLARKKAAAEALLTAVSSANNPIRGGLFDPSTEVVIPVDGLLVLLGEALPLLKESPRVLDLPQIFTLLKAVEDLQTIGPRIYAQCEAMFQSALDNVHGSDVPSPRAMLRKETSGMTASSQFSMIGSSMLNSMENGTVSEGSGVLIKSGDVKRGWDWRKGLRRSTKGVDVLRVVRLALSEAVAGTWASMDPEQMESP